MNAARTVTVLVADDSVTVRAVVRVELESAGFAVVEAEDGSQAVQLALDAPPDVVLLDVEMPVMDGYAAITALKASPVTRDIPVVFLTARASGGDVVEALRLGAHDYLNKPPDRSELLARVHAAAEVGALRAELRWQAKELDRLSRTDHLTGLPNRRELDDALGTMLASSRPHAFPVAALLVDVDRFKAVNDRLGHDAGDAVLREVGRRLAYGLRAEDSVGRWGGEEFLVLAHQAAVEPATVLAERLRRLVRASPYDVADQELAVTVSIGGAAVLAPGRSAGEVLRTADRNLYAAKAAGRDTVRVTAVQA